MNHTELIRLMHAVLDGVADAGETAALERHLAGDPDARAEFDLQRRLFDGLARIPKSYPPEGLVASVMANLPPQFPQPTAGQGRTRQPFERPRVIGQDSSESPDTLPGKSLGVPRFSGQGPYFRSDKMSEEKSGSFGKRKLLIGGGIAAVAVVLAVSSGIDFPPGSKDTAGTIVPAQRYKAPSNSRGRPGGWGGSDANGTTRGRTGRSSG